MLKLNQFILEKTSIEATHNTDSKSKIDILKNGFKISAKIKRKKLFGSGIYFSEVSNSRWGNAEIKVKISPKKVLDDNGGDIRYHETPIGKKIKEVGEKHIKNWDKEKGLIDQSPLWRDAIDLYIKKNNIDMLVSDEYGKKIFVVFNPKIISII